MRELLALRRARLARLLRRCAATRACVWSESRQGRASPTASCPASCSPAATRSATRRPGRARSGSSSARPSAHAWTPAVHRLLRAGRRGLVPRDGVRRARARRRGRRRRRRRSPSTGRPMRNVRQMVNRVAAGRLHHRGQPGPRLSPAELRARAIAAGRGAGASRDTERGFSMALGPARDPADPDCVLRRGAAGRGACARSCSSCPGAPTACRWT